MPRPFNARPLYRSLKALALPRGLVHRLLSAAKRMTVREQVERRRALALELAPPGGFELDHEHACRIFMPQELPGAYETAERCAELYEQFRHGGADRDLLERNRNKPFLLSIAAGNEFERYPELLRFAVARPLLDAAARYLGTVPVVEGIALWWTPPNDSRKSSQAWHVDELAPRQVKVLLNCFEVTEEQGPLHFIPAAISEETRERIRHGHGRLPDTVIESSGAAGQVRRAEGPGGSGVIFDSSRCLHYGSRGNRNDRLVLTFHYLPIDAPTETRYNLQLASLPQGLEDLDPIQRLALGFA